MSDHTLHQSPTVSVTGRPQFFQPGAESSTRYGRVPGIALSVSLHVTCLLGVIVITHSAAVHTARPKTVLMFAPVSLAAPVDAPRQPPQTARVALRRVAPPPTVPHAPAPADEAIRKIERPVAIAPPPVTPIVDADRLQALTNVVPNPPRIAGIAVQVGTFEPVTAGPAKGREPAAVMPAGFGDASARGAIRALPAAAPASAGFDREAAPLPAVAANVAPAAAFGNTSIEILFKPKPRYTDEAEALGIQGTVVLEVEFTASSNVRVLRVIRPLGHGLDEAAVRAAEQIRFKPARRQGVAVDARVTVQIEFRLT